MDCLDGGVGGLLVGDLVCCGVDDCYVWVGYCGDGVGAVYVGE